VGEKLGKNKRLIWAVTSDERTAESGDQRPVNGAEELVDRRQQREWRREFRDFACGFIF